MSSYARIDTLSPLNEMDKGVSIPQAYAQGIEFLYAIVLFIINDYPLVITPTLLSGTILGGPSDLPSVGAAFVWLNLHLLAFNIQNQLAGIEEDRLCKPFRPLPAGRISVKNARFLYFAVVAASVAWSFRHGLLPLSIIYSGGTWFYNEYGLAANPFLKTPMCGIAYICYTGGAAFIIGHHQTLTMKSIYAILTSGLIFGLTGHMQDFRDRSGDALMGRRTIPLILPQAVARWSLLLIISAFTYALVTMWSPPILVTCVFALFALITVTTLVATHSEEKDRVNFHWYEGWLICAHLLPLFRRISDGELALPGQLLFVQ
ncbi:hypothetical protein V5O48_006546 [Marasmius crinis-equi]|uniref:UbiA prenyltransferase n=1 Tax=Marasmius crinis-equi TaxID=585013 RepID=A0ABR3FK38_9AGAR